MTIGSDFFMMMMMMLATTGGDGGGDDSRVGGTFGKLLVLFETRVLSETSEVP